jgi:hypothetical protein
MPHFDVDSIEIEPYEFVPSCNNSEIRELINELVRYGHLPESVLISQKENERATMFEQDFGKNMDKLSKMYYSIPKEDIESLEEMFKKYL